MDLTEIRIDECFEEILGREAVREGGKGIIEKGSEPLMKSRKLETRQHEYQNMKMPDLRAASCRIAHHCK